MNIFPKRLRELRKKRKYSQVELSELCEMSENIVNYYENGRIEPKASSLIKLADVLETSVDYLLGRV